MGAGLLGEVAMDVVMFAVATASLEAELAEETKVPLCCVKHAVHSDVAELAAEPAESVREVATEPELEPEPDMLLVELEAGIAVSVSEGACEGEGVYMIQPKPTLIGFECDHKSMLPVLQSRRSIKLLTK